VNTRTLPLGRIVVALAAIGLIALSAAVLVRPVHAGADKWFVCKYVGTPGVDETLQTGNNPISVAASAIGIDPVVPGTFFADSQGRSYVLVADTGQAEPSVDLCPPPGTEQSVPPSAEQSVAASVSASVPASVPASAEGSVKAGTGTPAASTSNTALFGDGSNPLPTVAFSLILLASLGTLAYANVKTVRSRS
jgi:hypothetical protein